VPSAATIGESEVPAMMNPKKAPPVARRTRGVMRADGPQPHLLNKGGTHVGRYSR